MTHNDDNREKHILICGYRLHGKSTLAKFLSEEINGDQLEYQVYSRKNMILQKVSNGQRLAFADILKDSVCAKLGITRQELELNKAIYRHYLVEEATRVKQISPSYYVDRLLEIRPLDKLMIIEDLRHKIELERFVEEGLDFTIVRVFNSYAPIPPNDAYEEHDLDNLVTDHIVLCQGSTIMEFLEKFPQYHIENYIGF